VIIGTAGHIDHGKTTLIKALTGINTDRLEEEQLRGISIDIGFAHMTLGAYQVGFIDVPGHEKFIKNMLAGIGGIQFVLLVVAADESIMPQTVEHFQICKLLGISQGVIAITKKNLVDKDLLSLAEIEVRELIQGSPLEKAPVVTVDSLSGEGIEDLRSTLLHQIEKTEHTSFEFRKTHQVSHLPIDRVFAIRGFGTVVTGTLVSGSIKKGDLVTIYPSTKTARVRGIQIFNQQSNIALAGQRTALNLVGIQKEKLDRGMVVSCTDTTAPSSMIDATIHLLPDSPQALKQHSSIRFHHGSSELIGRLYLLEQDLLSPGDSTLAQIRLENPTVCNPKDPFILRRYSPMTTIGGGVVLDAHPQKHRKSDLEQVLPSLKHLRKMWETNDPKIDGALLEYFVQSDGSSGTTLSQLVVRTGFVEAYILNLLKILPNLVLVSQKPVSIVSKENLKKLKNRIVSFLRNFHTSHPLATGLPKEELKERFLNKAASSYFQFVLELLEEEKQISLESKQVALYGQKATLTEEQEEIKTQLLKLFNRKILQVPNLVELTQQLPHNPEQVQNVFYFLLESDELIRISKNVVLLPDQIHYLQSQLHKSFPNKQKFSVAQFKDLFKITRKYAIPLLEFLDRNKITQRIGNKRLVR